MRTTSTLFGLVLFALTAATARAEDATVAQPTVAQPTVAQPIVAQPTVAQPTVAQPTVAQPAVAQPTVAQPTVAQPASAVAPAPAPHAQAAATRRKVQIGLSFLPMGRGKYIYSPDTVSTLSSDAAFAYGLGLSAGYEVLPHLVVGLAPQVIFNVKEKAPEIASDPVRQYDLMARVAYVLPVADATEVYAEVLPGYSVLTNDAGASGVVVAFGLGGAIDLTDQIFVNLAAGYQIGFQTWTEGANTYQTRTRYIRVALGGGVKF